MQSGAPPLPTKAEPPRAADPREHNVAFRSAKVQSKHSFAACGQPDELSEG